MTEEEKDNAFCEDCQRCYEDEIEELEKENTKLKSMIPSWHDLRKRPKDLPKEEKNYLIYTEGFGIEIRKYYSDVKGFYCRPIRMVIAWCEIPKFKEE